MAVYTTVSENDLPQILARYDFGDSGQLTPIAEGIENTNYRLDVKDARYILTLFEKRTRAEDLPYFIAFMNHLRGRGIPCPHILADKSGTTLGMVAARPAIVSSFLEGRPAAVLDASACAAMGAMLARMHLAAADFTLDRVTTLSAATCADIIGRVGARTNEIEDGLADELERASRRVLENLSTLRLPRGAVHADVFPDNVFMQGNGISGVIDFYFSSTDDFVYDLMLTINAWCGAGGSFRADCAAAFLRAYHAVRPLQGVEIKALSLFGQRAALRIAATRLFDWFHTDSRALVTRKNPLEHINLLRWHRAHDVAEGLFI